MKANQAISALQVIQSKITKLLPLTALDMTQNTMLGQALRVILVNKATTELELRLQKHINDLTTVIGVLHYHKRVTSKAHAILQESGIQVNEVQDFFKVIIYIIEKLISNIKEFAAENSDSNVFDSELSTDIINNLNALDDLIACFEESNNIWRTACITGTFEQSHSYLIEEWLESEAKELSECLNKQLTTIIELAKYLFKERSTVNNFLSEYSIPNKADVYICSIGCGGAIHQQVYPWVYDFAYSFPNIRIRIDLFDRFSSEAATALELPHRDEKKTGEFKAYPECVLMEPHMWVKVSDNQFRHKEFTNINVHAHDTYFPSSIQVEFFGDKFYESLESAVEQHLANGRLVYLSQHSGGNFIAHELVVLYNKLNIYKVPNYQNMILMGCHGETYDPIALGFKDEPEALKLLLLNTSDSEINHAAESELATYLTRNRTFLGPQIVRISFAFDKWKKTGKNKNDFPFSKYIDSIPDVQPQDGLDIHYSKTIYVPPQVSNAVRNSMMTPLKSPTISLTLNFNRLANNFHILDQVSESLPEFYLLPEYKYVLEHEFADKDLLSEYRKLRKKYQTAPDSFTMGEKHGNLFAPNPEELSDPILDAFFTSESVEQALGKLECVLSHEEISLISEVFKKYEPIFTRLEIENASAMAHNLNLINANLDHDKVEHHLSLTRSFYKSAPKDFSSIQLFWNPLETVFTGCAYGDHLVVRTSANKIPDKDFVKMLVSIIVHEATHHTSGYAAAEQKLRLSKKLHPEEEIEELLVLAIQMVFLKHNYPEIFERNGDWFNDFPTANKIFPIVERYFIAKQVIDDQFIEECAVALTEFTRSSRLQLSA